MTLTEQQREATRATIAELNVLVNKIVQAREHVLAVVEIDELVPESIVDPLALIQAAKARALVGANDLIALLEP